MLKNLFATGLITVLPIAFSYIILKFVLDIITSPFLDLYNFYIEPRIEMTFPKYSMYLSYAPVSTTIIIIKQLVILVFVLLAILLVGLVVKYIFSPGLTNMFVDLTNRVPLLNTTYITVRQVIATIFKEESKSFKQVVLVPFNGGHAFGLITGTPDYKSISKTNKVSVFIPTAPSPVSGFLITYSIQDVEYIDMSIQDLFKHIVSLGLISKQQNVDASK